MRQLLAGRLAGQDKQATHVLVADPSYGRPTPTWMLGSGPCGPERSWWATQVNRIARRDDGEHLDTGGWVRLLEYATGRTARVLSNCL